MLRLSAGSQRLSGSEFKVDRPATAKTDYQNRSNDNAEQSTFAMEKVDSLDLKSGNLGTSYSFQHRMIQDHVKSTRMTETKTETDFW